jgi:hypothetical protein
MTGEQRLFGFLDGVECHLPAHGWETLQKAVYAVAGFDVVKQRSDQHARAAKVGWPDVTSGSRTITESMYPLSRSSSRRFVVRTNLNCNGRACIPVIVLVHGEGDIHKKLTVDHVLPKLLFTQPYRQI